jgi:hypothetical protein
MSENRNWGTYCHISDGRKMKMKKITGAGEGEYF